MSVFVVLTHEVTWCKHRDLYLLKPRILLSMVCEGSCCEFACTLVQKTVITYPHERSEIVLTCCKEYHHGAPLYKNVVHRSVSENENLFVDVRREGKGAPDTSLNVCCQLPGSTFFSPEMRIAKTNSPDGKITELRQHEREIRPSLSLVEKLSAVIEVLNRQRFDRVHFLTKQRFETQSLLAFKFLK